VEPRPLRVPKLANPCPVGLAHGGDAAGSDQLGSLIGIETRYRGDAFACNDSGKGLGERARGGFMEGSSEETGQVTGIKDKNYNLIWFTEQCLSNALRLETYVQDAERDGDSELADLFRRAQEASRRGGEQGKEALQKRLSG
jgi:hypothetical protein